MKIEVTEDIVKCVFSTVDTISFFRSRETLEVNFLHLWHTWNYWPLPFYQTTITKQQCFYASRSICWKILATLPPL